MRIWIACFLVIFALTEILQWVKHFSLPLPLNIVFGALLAIASNFDKLFGVEFPATNSPPVVTINNSPPSPQSTNTENPPLTQLKQSQSSSIDITASPPKTPIKKHREPTLPVLPKNR